MPTALEFPQDKKEIAALAAKRPVIFFAATMRISPARFKELLKIIPRGFTPVFGFHLEKKIDRLDGPVFLPQRSWAGFKLPKISLVVQYREKDVSDLVVALRPRRLVFVHGSWCTALYFREVWHAAFQANAQLAVQDIKLISPYTRAEAEKKRGKFGNTSSIKTRKATIFDRRLIRSVVQAASQSLCWVRQRGAVVIRGRKILVSSFNRVWPYDSYCLEKGCVREANLIPSGQQLEKCFTAHAETGVISRAARQGIKLDGSVMYTTTFPCINCAKVIVGSGIKEIVFWEDYANRDGELILRGGGIKLTKLKI